MDTFQPPQLNLDIYESPSKENSSISSTNEVVSGSPSPSTASAVEWGKNRLVVNKSYGFTQTYSSQFNNGRSPTVFMDVAEQEAPPDEPSQEESSPALSAINLNEMSIDDKGASSSSYGTWKFCRKTGKKVYIARSGKKLTGKAAAQQQLRDKRILKTSDSSARKELSVLISDFNVRLDSGEVKVDESSKQLQYWGLPSRTVARYASAGVCLLFDWQVECLIVDSCSSLRGNSLVYSAPTSGGKTLVAEILMLRRLAARAGTIFFVVPFIALVEEKAEYLREVWQDLDVSVKVFYNEEGGDDLPPDTDVCICTIEKANMLVNKLFETGCDSQVSMVIVDELHMVSDRQRGFLLEILLSKILFTQRYKVQIVGMSATLPNLQDLSLWIKGSLYSTSFRPVVLQTLVCMDNKLYSIVPSLGSTGIKQENTSKYFDFEYVSSVKRLNLTEDTDGFVSLCVESVAKSKSVLLFCPTKERCEVCCKLIVKALRMSNQIYDVSRSDLEQYNLGVGRQETLDDLQKTPVGVCSILFDSIKYGVAYHHAGLISDERKILEDAFRKGFISVLCTTSTLSAGVNLPAHRVIVRDTKMGPNYLSVSTFRQMAGRAGRLGYNSSGEAILHIANTSQSKALAVKLIAGELEPLRSSLHEGFGGGVHKLLLDMVCSKGLKNFEDVNSFIDCTLMKIQQPSSLVHAETASAMEYLIKYEFIKEVGGEFRPTQKGCAASHSGISPFEVDEVLSALDQARKKFILKSGLHSVYLVTPISSRISVNWTRYHIIIDLLIAEQPAVKDTLVYLGLQDSEIAQFQLKPPRYDCTNHRTRFYKRLYCSIILYNIVQENSISKVADSISSNRGDIQQLQKDASMFCGMTVAFARKLNWCHVSAVLETYSSRLSFGVRDELLPLVRMGAEMPAFRARFFYGCGLKSPLDISKAGIDVVSRILIDSVPFNEHQPIVATKQHLSTLTTSDAQLSMSNNNLKTKYDRLASKIVEIAKEIVKKEIERMQTFL